MGEVSVKIKLENAADATNVSGSMQPVRSHEMQAVVDTGAVMLALPQDVTEKLGLRFVRKAIVSYADERREELDVVGPVTIHVAERQMMAECIVLPPRAEALIGQVILESLDLVVDCQRKILGPHPDSPIYPSLKLK